MAEENKKNKNAYEVDQLLLDMNSQVLESATEKNLTETIKALQEKKTEVRKERLQKQKNFLVAYKNARDRMVELKDKITKGKLNPDTAIENFRTFVSSEELIKDTTPSV